MGRVQAKIPIGLKATRGPNELCRARSPLPSALCADAQKSVFTLNRQARMFVREHVGRPRSNPRAADAASRTRRTQTTFSTSQNGDSCGPTQLNTHFEGVSGFRSGDKHDLNFSGLLVFLPRRNGSVCAVKSYFLQFLHALVGVTAHQKKLLPL